MCGKKKKPQQSFDPSAFKPVLCKSICTGETTAGFLELHGGRFREVMLIRSDRDLAEFMETYGLESIPETIY